MLRRRRALRVRHSYQRPYNHIAPPIRDVTRTPQRSGPDIIALPISKPSKTGPGRPRTGDLQDTEIASKGRAVVGSAKATANGVNAPSKITPVPRVRTPFDNSFSHCFLAVDHSSDVTSRRSKLANLFGHCCQSSQLRLAAMHLLAGFDHVLEGAKTGARC